MRNDLNEWETFPPTLEEKRWVRWQIVMEAFSRHWQPVHQRWTILHLYPRCNTILQQGYGITDRSSEWPCNVQDLNAFWMSRCWLNQWSSTRNMTNSDLQHQAAATKLLQKLALIWSAMTWSDDHHCLNISGCENGPLPHKTLVSYRLWSAN